MTDSFLFNTIWHLQHWNSGTSWLLVLFIRTYGSLRTLTLLLYSFIWAMLLSVYNSSFTQTLSQRSQVTELCHICDWWLTKCFHDIISIFRTVLWYHMVPHSTCQRPLPSTRVKLQGCHWGLGPDLGPQLSDSWSTQPYHLLVRMTLWAHLVPLAPLCKLHIHTIHCYVSTSYCTINAGKIKCLFSENAVKAEITDCFIGQDVDYHTSSE